MTIVKLIKDIPSSDYYTGSGTTTIYINSSQIILNTKKSLIKTPRKRTKARQTSSPTDQPENKVIDLQDIQETMVIRGWLDDDGVETAWNKLWKLRAMCTRGGPLFSLTIASAVPIVFGQGDLWQGFIEDVTQTIKTDDSGDISVSQINAEARIEVSLAIYFGDER